MTLLDFIQVILFFSLLIGLPPILGNYMFKVFSGDKHIMKPVLVGLKN